MAYIPLGYNNPLVFPSRYGLGINAEGITTTNSTIDATDEEVHFIGNLELPAGTTSVTFNTNTSIQWQAGTTTFANAGTTLRIGVQDVDATTGIPGRGDGTFDCYADLVGGTDTITGSSWQTTTMETGSKTVNNGDLIAICFKLVSRGGTDSIAINCATTTGTTSGRPLSVSNLGSGFSIGPGLPTLAINFNGTYATLTGATPYKARSLISFNSASNPNERGNIFTFPFGCKVIGAMGKYLCGVAGTAFDLKLYSDPLGTPAVLTNGSVTIDTDTLASTASDLIALFPAAVPLQANTKYALAILPSSSSNINFSTIAYDSADVAGLHFGGSAVAYCSRNGGTGAFTELSTTKAVLHLLISHIDAGASPTYLAGVM